MTPRQIATPKSKSRLRQLFGFSPSSKKKDSSSTPEAPGTPSTPMAPVTSTPVKRTAMLVSPSPSKGPTSYKEYQKYESLRRNTPGRSSMRKEASVHKSDLWSSTVDPAFYATVPRQEAKRQEVIHEIIQSEEGYVADLTLLVNVFKKPMEKLNMVSAAELQIIFGNIEQLVSPHTEMCKLLVAARKENNLVHEIGDIFLQWFPRFRSIYGTYCGERSVAKDEVDRISKTNGNVADLLRRCIDLAQCRKLDMWSFLDEPRRRLQKYPLLLSAVLKHTPPEHPDHSKIVAAIAQTEEVIRDVDSQTGMAKLTQLNSALLFASKEQEIDLVNDSYMLVLEGGMRARDGHDLHAFLFDRMLMFTRLVTKGGVRRYAVRDVVPLVDLEVEAVENDTGRFGKSLSIRSISDLGGDGGINENVLRFHFTEGPNKKQVHRTVQVPNRHELHAWITTTRQLSDTVKQEHGAIASLHDLDAFDGDDISMDGGDYMNGHSRSRMRMDPDNDDSISISSTMSMAMGFGSSKGRSASVSRNTSSASLYSNARESVRNKTAKAAATPSTPTANGRREKPSFLKSRSSTVPTIAAPKFDVDPSHGIPLPADDDDDEPSTLSSAVSMTSINTASEMDPTLDQSVISLGGAEFDGNSSMIESVSSPSMVMYMSPTARSRILSSADDEDDV
ncbi:hypothetical protein, variant [Capsaspora owczarzaki ATCC 30864]|nr:hypothetical protein, variant [Capsaspora owczarzaki ATCC 30864]KJE92360.1 hypothetical protein, variant [Capsaspora owczarzaki ATCC 30864]|eukprot:XP_011270242.1 hypothetical protein, variant [Capsaspora owczarzaki ATCC 30864]